MRRIPSHNISVKSEPGLPQPESKIAKELDQGKVSDIGVETLIINECVEDLENDVAQARDDKGVLVGLLEVQIDCYLEKREYCQS